MNEQENCKYCHETGRDAFNRRKGAYFNSTDDNEIFYCPMCGRQLEE